MSENTTPSPTLWERLQHWMHGTAPRPKIGVALGGGGALGVAHIGVLSVFHELNIPIAYLSGCSAGAFVGALYAGGVEGKALETCGLEYNWRHAGRLTIPPRMGLATNLRMASYLRKHIGEPAIESLRLPFYVVATNLTTGTLRVFHTGPVIPAVRASCAIPGIFEPVTIDGDPYCDGGVLDKVPCGVLRDAGADVVICVELSTFQRGRPPTTIFEVISRALDISRSSQEQADRQAADLIIRPDVSGLNPMSFDQNLLLLARGREAARAQLQQSPLHA